MAILIEGTCPSCGQTSLFLKQNRIQCNRPECDRPTAAQEILSEPQRTDHLVRLDTHGFSVVHPLRERLNNQLLHCSLADHVAEFGHDEWIQTGLLAPGVTYRMWSNSGVSRTPEGDDYWFEVEWPINDAGHAISFEEEQRG